MANLQAWQEVRARVDSTAHALFLVAGGALSVSIAVMLGDSAPSLSPTAKHYVALSWYSLTYTLISFILVKALLIVQSERTYRNSPNKEKWHKTTYIANWTLGITGVIAFSGGMVLLIITAEHALK